MNWAARYAEAARELDELRSRAAEAVREARSERYERVSRDRTVTAAVDGNGAVLTIRIDEAALHGAHPQLLGAEVVDAIRGQAGRGRGPPDDGVTPPRQEVLTMPPMDYIENYVAEIERDLAAVHRRVAARGQARIDEPIRYGLGIVTVDGHGRLLGVELDRSALRYTSGASIGQEIVTALWRAEARAAAPRSSTVQRNGNHDG